MIDKERERKRERKKERERERERERKRKRKRESLRAWSHENPFMRPWVQGERDV